MEQAALAITQGNSPFGAVLADADGHVIASAYNTVNTETDPTAHAEMNLIRSATKMLGTKRLPGYVLISNAQSCPMCFSAAVRAGIRNFVYGYAEDETLVPNIDVHKLSEFCVDPVDITTGVLSDECEGQIKSAARRL